MQTVSIVIPHREQPVQLLKCLDRLIELGYHDQEILVVNNELSGGPSQDQNVYLDSLKQYPVTLIHVGDRPSPYMARNEGIKKAGSGIIALLDVNCVVEEGWLESALKTLVPEMILSGVPAPPSISNCDSWQRFDYLYSYLDSSGQNPVKALPATNLFFYRSAWKKIGPFEEVRSLGDMEWTIRARQAGYKLKIDGSVRFRYPYKSGQSFRAKFRRLGGGMMENGFIKYPILYILKNFLPPSPKFVRRMHRLNRKEDMKLSWFKILFICYCVKMNYALGVLRYYNRNP